MKKKNIIRLIVALALVVCLSATFVLMAEADFGDFGGDSDYGGGDWGGGGFDWDTDSGSSGGSFIPIFFGSGSSWITYVVMAVIIAAVIFFIKKKGGQNKPPVQVNTATNYSTLNPVSTYSALDPTFDAQALRDKLSNLYVQMQNAWTAKNLESVQPYFTDAYYKQMERQVQSYIVGKKTNYVEKIAVLGVELMGWKQDGNQDHMIARVSTRITDYTLSDVDGSLVSGDRSKEKFMVYEWDLSRESGRTTGTEKEDSGIDSKSCPHCGAPLDINATARCAYCGSVITTKKHDWAICNIKGISQRTQ